MVAVDGDAFDRHVHGRNEEAPDVGFRAGAGQVDRLGGRVVRVLTDYFSIQNLASFA